MINKRNKINSIKRPFGFNNFLSAPLDGFILPTGQFSFLHVCDSANLSISFRIIKKINSSSSALFSVITHRMRFIPTIIVAAELFLPYHYLDLTLMPTISNKLKTCQSLLISQNGGTTNINFSAQSGCLKN
jgi:hypothetical protein